MALYSVYEPGEPSADLVERADHVVFVKDGFCWPALFVAPFWLLYHQMWIGLALFFGGAFLLDLVLSLNAVGEAISTWATFGYLFFFAMEANGLRRYSLERKGYEFAGMVVGGNREEAEVRFFSEWLPGQRRAGQTPGLEKSASSKANPGKTIATKMSGGAQSQPSRGSDDGIIGSFPNG